MFIAYQNKKKLTKITPSFKFDFGTVFHNDNAITIIFKHFVEMQSKKYIYVYQMNIFIFLALLIQLQRRFLSTLLALCRVQIEK